MPKKSIRQRKPSAEELELDPMAEAERQITGSAESYWPGFIRFSRNDLQNDLTSMQSHLERKL